MCCTTTMCRENPRAVAKARTAARLAHRWRFRSRPPSTARRCGLAWLSRALGGIDRSGFCAAVLRLAADLDLPDQLVGDSSMCADAASFGLATKSNAPNASALNVAEAPWVVCELTMITGTRCTAHDLAQSLHAVHARHFQIERDHVRLSSSIFLRPNSPSIAVPTT